MINVVGLHNMDSTDILQQNMLLPWFSCMKMHEDVKGHERDGPCRKYSFGRQQTLESRYSAPPITVKIFTPTISSNPGKIL